MPEGDTVFKLAAYLRPELSGRLVLSGVARATAPIDLRGSRIDDVYARGKHLFIALDRQRLLRSHLGMWGSWHGYAPGEAWLRPRRRASIILDIGERVFVCFNALHVELLRVGGVRSHTLDAALGPDLLQPPVDFDTAVKRARALSAPGRAIADVLLDQRIACGIGNVYKSEVLFLESCHPALAIDRVDDALLDRLYRRASRLLGRNTRGGPRITRPANDQAGRLWVYGRTGQPCLRCDTPIASRLFGERQRSTYWCPRCQRLTDLAPSRRSRVDRS